MKKRDWIIRIASLMVISLYLYLRIRDIPDIYFEELFPTYSKWLFLAFHMTCFFYIVYPLLRQFVYQQAEKVIINRLEKSSYFGERVTIINETGILIERADTKTTYQWKDIVRVSEDKSRYYLYVSDLKAVILKKKATNLSEEDQKEYDYLLRKYTIPLMSKEIKDRKKLSLSLKARALLLIPYLFSIGISKQDWGITLNEATKEVYGLFENTNGHYEEWHIKDNLTPDKINRARKMVYHIYDIDFNIFDIEEAVEQEELFVKVNEAEEKLNRKIGVPKKTTSMTYSGESETWEIVDYKIEISTKRIDTEEKAIYMKENPKHPANFYRGVTYVVFNEEIFKDHKLSEFILIPKQPNPLQENYSEDKLGFVMKTTSEVMRMNILKKSGEPVFISDIKQVYFIIEWKPQPDSEVKREKVILTANGGNF